MARCDARAGGGAKEHAPFRRSGRCGPKGVTAASAGVAYEAVVGTDTSNEWRGWLGPHGSISLGTAAGAVAVGAIALMAGDSHPLRCAMTLLGAGLGLLTLGYWLWVIESILDTT